MNKIIYIVNAKIPTAKAHGYQITKMCEEFARQGVDVDPVRGREGSQRASASNGVELWLPDKKEARGGDVFKEYSLINNFAIKKLPTVEFAGYWAQLISFYFFAILRAVFLNRKTIIYSRDLAPSLLSFLGFRVVFECHRVPERGRNLFLFMSRRLHRIVAVTSGIADVFLKGGVDASGISVVPDAFDPKTFDINISKEEARKKLKLPQDKKILMYCGAFRTMSMGKGIEEILGALKMFDESVVFVAVGGTTEDIIYYQSKADGMELSGRVIFLPRVGREEVAFYERAADVLLMPFPYTRHYAYYMSPLKMFEYMASGRPIVTTDLPAIRDVLSEKSAVLVQPDDVNALYRGVKTVLDDEPMAERIAQKAKTDVVQYTWSNRARKIIGFIN